MSDSLDTSESDALPWVKPALAASGNEDAQTMTKEERALGAFLAAMHDSKLDGGKMRAAMLKVLGLETSTAERLRELEEEIAVSDKLLEHRQQLLQAIPECPAHGHGCVPYALEWIENAKQEQQSELSVGVDFADDCAHVMVAKRFQDDTYEVIYSERHHQGQSAPSNDEKRSMAPDEAVKIAARGLLDFAHRNGVVLTISRRPLQPPAMGHAEYVVETREIRKQS